MDDGLGIEDYGMEGPEDVNKRMLIRRCVILGRRETRCMYIELHYRLEFVINIC
jgi:hypothetical protein